MFFVYSTRGDDGDKTETLWYCRFDSAHPCAIETEENRIVSTLRKALLSYMLGAGITTGACLFFSRKDGRSLSTNFVESGIIGAVWPLTLVATLFEGTKSEMVGSA